MPPPPVRYQRPTVKKPVLQKQTNANVTSTDTWNKPNSVLQIAPPSTKSTVPGVDLKKTKTTQKPVPPRKTSGSSTNSYGSAARKLAAKPLPGAKLRPLQANSREDNYYAQNTSVVAVKSTKAKLNSPTGNKTQQSNGSPASRSSSVASLKPVLPGIQKAPEQVETNEEPEKHVVMREEKKRVETPKRTGSMVRQKSVILKGRAQSSRRRDGAAAKLREEAANETNLTDKYNTDYFVPTWYRDPLVRPEVLKGGVTVFTIAPFDDNVDHLDVNFINITALWYAKDLEMFMKECQDRSLLTLTYFNTGKKEIHQQAMPRMLSKGLALEANGLTSQSYYKETVHNPEVFYRHVSLADVKEEDTALFHQKIDVAKYYMELAESLGIKSLKEISELDSAIVKAQKRRINVEKQEKANHPHVYLQPFESTDVWNHVNTCHTLSDNCFTRTKLLDKVRAAIKADAKVQSSPILISGAMKSGKTYICAQIPKMMGEEAVTLVRFSGLTQLTKTLPKMLRGISKQLHLLFGSLIMPRSVEHSSISDIAELFKSVLTQVSQYTKKQVVLVLDAVEELAEPNADILKFITLCQSAVPCNLTLVITLRSSNDESVFFDGPTLAGQDYMSEFEKELLGSKLVTRMLDHTSVPEYALVKKLLNSEEDKDTIKSVVGSACEELMARDKWTKSTDDIKTYDDAVAFMKDCHGKLMAEVVNKIKNYDADQDKSAVSKAITDFKEGITDVQQKRESLKRYFEEKLEKVVVMYPDIGDDFIDIGLAVTADWAVDGETHIHIPELSTQEGEEYIHYLSQGKYVDSETNTLTEIAKYVHNPLLLRLIFNRCFLVGSASFLVQLYKQMLDPDSQNDSRKAVAQQIYEKTTHCKEVQVQWLAHVITMNLVYCEKVLFTLNGETGEIEVAPTPSAPSFQDLSPYRLTDSDIFLLNVGSLCEVDSIKMFSLLFVKQVMEGCHLSVYEQGDYVRDVEQVESLLRANLVSPSTTFPVSKLDMGSKQGMRSCVATILRRIYSGFLALATHGQLEEVIQEFIDLSDEVLEEFVDQNIGDTEALHESISGKGMIEQISEWLDLLVPDQEAHEVDSWYEVKKLSELEDGEWDFESLLAPSGVRNPVTSGKEKNYPQGRRKVTYMNLLEKILTASIYELTDKSESKAPLAAVIDLLMHYDFLVPLLQEFGADYVVEAYGDILELIHRIFDLLDITTLDSSVRMSLELLYNLLVVYITPLRENPNNFYTLFLSLFNEDTALSSRAGSRLYKRVHHEVDVRNNLHVVTMLSKSAEASLLSKDTKKYLHNASQKYQASQCISNFYYILSHNNSNLIKLWELTGEFISAQKFEGRIVSVCAQRAAKCFLAVVETVSEVGQKFASVWHIDRLANKKLADIGSKTIISAWFNKEGDKLVLVEQHTVDELKIVVCTPQTMEVKLEDNVINIVPYKESSFMNKCLELPEKVDKQLLEILNSHLTGDKKDADPTDLHFFQKTPDGTYELDPRVATNPLIFDSLELLWDDILDKFDAKDDMVYPMKEICSDIYPLKEHTSRMKITLHGMTSTGDIVVDCQYSDKTHNVLFYKLQGDSVTLSNELAMDEQATMTLMPTDDFVYSDTGSNSGLISWNLPTNDKKIFGNEQKVHVTCLQFEAEEGQILSFTRGQVTVWNAIQKTTESSFTLDKGADIVAACLQDNWLAMANRDGELSIRFEIRKKIDTYKFQDPIDWIDCHVIGDYLYIACHLNGKKPTICFLKYRVSDAPLYEKEKYVPRPL